MHGLQQIFTLEEVKAKQLLQLTVRGKGTWTGRSPEVPSSLGDAAILSSLCPTDVGLGDITKRDMLAAQSWINQLSSVPGSSLSVSYKFNLCAFYTSLPSFLIFASQHYRAFHGELLYHWDMNIAVPLVPFQLLRSALQMGDSVCFQGDFFIKVEIEQDMS